MIETPPSFGGLTKVLSNMYEIDPKTALLDRNYEKKFKYLKLLFYLHSTAILQSFSNSKTSIFSPKNPISRSKMAFSRISTILGPF